MGLKVGQHDLVCRVLNACFNARPPHPRYVVTWDRSKTWRAGVPQLLLSYIRPHTEVVPCTIAGWLKSSDLRARDIRYMSINEHSIRFELGQLTKSSRKGQPPVKLNFDRYDSDSLLLMAPTGVSAINRSRTTVNTALAIPKETGKNLPAMSHQKKTQMRVSLSELRLIIIGELSMISNITLLQIHQPLKDIFGASASQLFAGLSVVVVGELYQLPPVRRKPIFESFKNDSYNLCHPWHVFQIKELTEIMRQRDDQNFSEA